MKTLIPVLAILVAGTAFAQRHGGGGMRPSGYGSGTGFGSILNPGTGRPPAAYNGWRWPGRGGNGYRSRGLASGYPIFIGGYGYGYGSGYGYGYDQPAPVEQQPPQTVFVQQPAAQAAAPPVIINQYFTSGGPPEMTVGEPQTGYRPTAARQEDKPTIYLIAMKDHTIMPALGYWIEGDTLTYITSQGTKNSVSLTLVDRNFSKQLNDERHVEFSL